MTNTNKTNFAMEALKIAMENRFNFYLEEEKNVEFAPICDVNDLPYIIGTLNFEEKYKVEIKDFSINGAHIEFTPLTLQAQKDLPYVLENAARYYTGTLKWDNEGYGAKSPRFSFEPFEIEGYTLSELPTTHAISYEIIGNAKKSLENGLRITFEVKSFEFLN